MAVPAIIAFVGIGVKAWNALSAADKVKKIRAVGSKKKTNKERLKTLMDKVHVREKKKHFQAKPKVELLEAPKSSFTKAQTKTKKDLQRVGEALENADSYLDKGRVLKGSIAKNKTAKGLRGKTKEEKEAYLKDHFDHIKQFKAVGQRSTNRHGVKLLARTPKTQKLVDKHEKQMIKEEKAPKLLMLPKGHIRMKEIEARKQREKDHKAKYDKELIAKRNASYPARNKARIAKQTRTEEIQKMVDLKKAHPKGHIKEDFINYMDAKRSMKPEEQEGC